MQGRAHGERIRSFRIPAGTTRKWDPYALATPLPLTTTFRKAVVIGFEKDFVDATSPPKQMNRLISSIFVIISSIGSQPNGRSRAWESSGKSYPFNAISPIATAKGIIAFDTYREGRSNCLHPTTTLGIFEKYLTEPGLGQMERLPCVLIRAHKANIHPSRVLKPPPLMTNGTTTFFLHHPKALISLDHVPSLSFILTTANIHHATARPRPF